MPGSPLLQGTPFVTLGNSVPTQHIYHASLHGNVRSMHNRNQTQHTYTWQAGARQPSYRTLSICILGDVIHIIIHIFHFYRGSTVVLWQSLAPILARQLRMYEYTLFTAMSWTATFSPGAVSCILWNICRHRRNATV